MQAPAVVAHQITGRVRIRVPAMRSQRQYFADTAERLAQVPGVLRITSTPDTASFLVEHQSDEAQLQAALNAIFDFQAPATAVTSEADSVGQTNDQAAEPSDWPAMLEKLRKACGNPNTGQALIALLLIAYGLWQLARPGRKPGPDWFTALWVAYNLMAIK